MDNLEPFRQLYLDYPRLTSEKASRNSTLPAISETGSRKLPATNATSQWQSGNLIILSQRKRPEEREFYLRQAIREKWSSREPQNQIKAMMGVCQPLLFLHMNWERAASNLFGHNPAVSTRY